MSHKTLPPICRQLKHVHGVLRLDLHQQSGGVQYMGARTEVAIKSGSQRYGSLKYF